jgi:predicted RNA-binding Zn-ribbon protein involved in translation (DUF1610 family)
MSEEFRGELDITVTPNPSIDSLDRELMHLKELIAFRDGIVESRVKYGNMLGAHKEGGKWVFIRRYSVCKNRHMILLKKDQKRDKCPLCGEPVRIVEETPSEDAKELFFKLLDLQETVDKLIAGSVVEFVEFEKFLAFIKGLGVINSAKLIANLFPKRFGYNVNKARKYAGLAVMFACPKCGYYYYGGESSNGKPAIQSKEGWRCPNDGTKLVGTAAKGVKYNREVKTFLLGVLAPSLKMAGGVYARIIRNFKEEIQAKHPDWAKLKVEMTARRKAISILLAQFFAISLHYREGVPLSEAYKIVLGKQYDELKEHKDFIEAPITDYYADIKSDKYKLMFEKTIEELGIDKNEVIEWLKRKKIIQ